MEGLTILSNIALILLLGLLCTLLSKKLRMSNVLILVLLGIILRFMAVDGRPMFDFSHVFLISVATLAIVMIVFDSTSRFKWKELDELSVLSVQLSAWFLLINMFFLSMISMFIIFRSHTLENYLYAMIFSVVMIATDPSSLFAMMGDIKNKTINLLEIESIINTPLTVLLPFVVLDLINALEELDFVSSFLVQILPFLQQIVVGIGVGVLIGIILFKIMRDSYSEQMSPVALITAALLSYSLAENMGGNGVLSVATLGLFFGSIYVKQKATLHEFSAMLSNSLIILVFVLVGLMVSLPLTFKFYLSSIFLFGVLLLCRGTAVFYTLRNQKYNTREKMFATLNIPKGIAMAVVVFTFSVLDIPSLTKTLDYMLAILVYSLILSTFVTRYSKYFLRIDVEKQLEKSS